MGVEKAKQKLVNGSSPKKTRKKSGATETALRRVSKKHDGEEEPGAGAGRFVQLSDTSFASFIALNIT